VGWGPTPGVMGAHARGVDRGMEGSWWGSWVACGKNVKSYKKKVVKIFSDGNFGGWSASKKRSPNIPASPPETNFSLRPWLMMYVTVAYLGRRITDKSEPTRTSGCHDAWKAAGVVKL
jgi:hypothetical protein